MTFCQLVISSSCFSISFCPSFFLSATEPAGQAPKVNDVSDTSKVKKGDESKVGEAGEIVSDMLCSQLFTIDFY